MAPARRDPARSARPFRPRDILKQVTVQDLAVAPDGSSIVYGRKVIEAGTYRKALWRTTFRGGRAERITPPTRTPPGRASPRTARRCCSSRTGRAGPSPGCSRSPAASPACSWTFPATLPRPNGPPTGAPSRCWRPAASSASSSASPTTPSPGASPITRGGMTERATATSSPACGPSRRRAARRPGERGPPTTSRSRSGTREARGSGSWQMWSRGSWRRRRACGPSPPAADRRSRRRHSRARSPPRPGGRRASSPSSETRGPDRGRRRPISSSPTARTCASSARTSTRGSRARATATSSTPRRTRTNFPCGWTTAR